MKKICIAVFAAALTVLAAHSMAGDDITSSVVPTDDGHGVVTCVSVSFDNIRELPGKTVKAVWSLFVCITQPIHPYHYVRDEQGKVVTDGDGGNKKVWLPFYRLWGEHQGDSVVGIVYDNRGTNGMAGSCWFAGYGNSGWQDKGGKLVGLALLALGTSKAQGSKQRGSVDYSRQIESEPVVPTRHSREEAREPLPQPQSTPVSQPTSPEGWDGGGGPVGRSTVKK
ncbi:MAG: hypothetical protein A2283_22080 [Lentisphaerae bacterium RIFOXYA12_FULL_48_11]|nr:MAG: hypothetical protein A2283_22080 [Lentisphaerae bacterium RIFOXYA12_FULL_48_11]